MTDMIKADGVVIKTDKLGRVQTPAVRREQLLDEFERSGLSGVKFAELTGIKYQTLATWLKKRRRGRGECVRARRSKRLRWLEAVAEPNLGLASNSGDKSPLMLELPGGAKVQITDAKQAALAAALLKALATPC
jgi:hypothetical protein